MEKHLDNTEVLEMDLMQKEQKIQKLERMLLEKDSAIIKHQQEHLKLKIGLLDAENLKLQTKIVLKSEKLKAEFKKAKEFNEKIGEKYEIQPGWGYNPDSLEIIQKEDEK